MPTEFEAQSYVQFDGLSKDESLERAIAFQTALSHYLRIRKKVKEDIRLHIHVKRHGSEGKHLKYTVKAKVSGPRLFYEASSTDWAFMPALKDSLTILERDVREKRKSTRPKSR